MAIEVDQPKKQIKEGPQAKTRHLPLSERLLGDRISEEDRNIKREFELSHQRRPQPTT